MSKLGFRAGWLIPGAIAAISAACSAGPAVDTGLGADSGVAPGMCTPCVIDGDCKGSVCAQFGGDSFCAVACPGGSGCGDRTTCSAETTIAGDPAKVCVPDNDACGKSPVSKDAGTTPVPPPDGGGPIKSQIANNGGTESRLLFAIVGDTRPPGMDQTGAYPTAIINKIFSDIKSLTPMPPFVVATGDYQFASAYMGNEASKQFALYTAASAPYRQAGGIEFPAMGNHECTGAVISNCGQGNQYPTTNNYTAFQAAMLAPIGKNLPYYVINVNATDGSWTSKFVFIAANAWNAAQASWLESTLASATTYTFIIRHESAYANTAPGVVPSEQIMAKHPYTLAIVGHTHTVWHTKGAREVVFGNGGAPLTSGYYGYGLVTQRADKSIQVDGIDMTTGNADSWFRFAVTPDGTTTK